MQGYLNIEGLGLSYVPGPGEDNQENNRNDVVDGIVVSSILSNVDVKHIF